MRNGIIKVALAGILAGLWTATAAAQQVRFFPDFSNMAYLQTNGSGQATYNGQKVLRLTKGGPPPGGTMAPYATTTWFTVAQAVNSGFSTYFRFQIHDASSCCAPGDGFAFVAQNATSTDASYGATGAGLTARGVANGGLGYAGIPNSLAVEFDTTANPWDPTINGSNHVAVQGCGTSTNGPVHVAGRYTIGRNNNVTSCLVGGVGGPGLNNGSTLPHLGVSCGNSSCTDGSPHDVVIEYAPVSSVWRLKVYVDQPFIPKTHTPCPSVNIPLGCPKAAVAAIDISYNIDNTQNPTTGLSLALDSKGNKAAYVGFAASQTSNPQQQDILAWEFTPHAPAQVQQAIQGCTPTPQNPKCTPPPTPFSFGSHDTVVNYYPGFQNTSCPDQPSEGPCLMTVVATPTPRSQFYINRLKPPPQPGYQSFANEQCVVYQGTGGNCIVYSITCQTTLHPNVNVQCPASLPNTCQNKSDPGCIQFSTSFYTSDGVTPQNADYLKTDPIGSNNWQSIFVSFDPNGFDPKTTGTGGSTSDFVATFAVGAKP